MYIRLSLRSLGFKNCKLDVVTLYFLAEYIYKNFKAFHSFYYEIVVWKREFLSAFDNHTRF